MSIIFDANCICSANKSAECLVLEFVPTPKDQEIQRKKYISDVIKKGLKSKLC